MTPFLCYSNLPRPVGETRYEIIKVEFQPIFNVIDIHTEELRTFLPQHWTKTCRCLESMAVYWNRLPEKYLKGYWRSDECDVVIWEFWSGKKLIGYWSINVNK